MAASAREMASLSGQHLHAIEELSEDLHLPLSEVAEVYQAELERIGAAARIHNYVSLLASRRAHAILRGRSRADAH
jgi:hypothetical protein